MTILLGLFLIAHGLIHLLYFVPTPSDIKPGKHWPFDGTRSWLLGRMGLPESARDRIAKALAVITAVGLVFAGLGLIGVPFPDALWQTVGALAAGIGLLLLLVYFDIQLVVGIGLNVVILAVLLTASRTE